MSFPHQVPFGHGSAFSSFMNFSSLYFQTSINKPMYLDAWTPLLWTFTSNQPGFSEQNIIFGSVCCFTCKLMESLSMYKLHAKFSFFANKYNYDIYFVFLVVILKLNHILVFGCFELILDLSLKVISSKFLNDEGEDDEIFNWSW